MRLDRLLRETRRERERRERSGGPNPPITVIELPRPRPADEPYVPPNLNRGLVVMYEDDPPLTDSEGS